MRRFFPNREQIRNHRWLRWIGPRLHHPRLWRWSRHGVALGVALGIFFGLLIPVAQIPVSAGAAVALRANLPAAVASTLVTNPLTFGPIYYGAYRIGAWVTGESSLPQQVPSPQLTLTNEEAGLWERVSKLGKPLLVGLTITATVSGLLAYGLIHVGWRLWRRRRPVRSRQ